MVPHAYCRDAHAKYINGNQEAGKVFLLQLPDGNRCEDLSLFYSLTSKNNIIMKFGEHTVSFTNSYVDDDM